MSYEYLIRCQYNDVESLFKSIGDAASENRDVEKKLVDGKMFLKDRSLPSTWSYDVSIKKGSDGVRVVLVGWSFNLYDIFKRAVQGFDIEVLDEDTEEYISIKDLFRIKKGPD
ncbi:hypothetical protein E4A48_09520 [Xanthomonas cerealis pv. cerealis]|uniref:Uncharacterized protein n=1 Tax=Xanthomonas cerealis pv. cerealis TaxID=152263 RepID=A0A514ECV1_9XANT|nr:hypothetical protein [Xanthomonas translucens]QDI03896.1 hypothetical protein E4A48_09520 [Xanthomonas translucens pv. cerealis]